MSTTTGNVTERHSLVFGDATVEVVIYDEGDRVDVNINGDDPCTSFSDDVWDEIVTFVDRARGIDIQPA